MENKKRNSYNPSLADVVHRQRPLYVLAAVMLLAVMVFTPVRDVVLSTVRVSAAESKTYLMGDIDLNGKLEPSDARSVLRVSVQLDELEGVKDGTVLPNDKAEPTKGQLADIDGDKRITPSDARAILRMSVMLDEQRTIRVEIPEETTTVPPPIIETTTSDDLATKIDETIAKWNNVAVKDGEVTQDQIAFVEKEMKDMLAQGYSWEEIHRHGSDLMKKYTYENEKTSTVEPSTTYDEWQEEYDKRWQKAYEYTIAELADYKNTTFFDECQSKVDDMLIAGKSDTEIKKFVKDFKAELKQNEEPTTYWTGEHNELCMWCGKETFINFETDERSCYHVSWINDHVCPGCGEFVKAHTCHDCKAYFDYLKAGTTIGEYDKPIDPDDIPDDVKYGYQPPVEWREYDENGNLIIKN